MRSVERRICLKNLAAALRRGGSPVSKGAGLRYRDRGLPFDCAHERRDSRLRRLSQANGSDFRQNLKKPFLAAVNQFKRVLYVSLIVVALVALAGCANDGGGGGGGDGTGGQKPEPACTDGDKEDQICLVDLDPAPGTTLTRGTSVSITATVSYVVASAATGTVQVWIYGIPFDADFDDTTLGPSNVSGSGEITLSGTVAVGQDATLKALGTSASLHQDGYSISISSTEFQYPVMSP